MAAPSTRRLAAILAADVVGYSRLMGEDETGTARAVREHRDASLRIVAAHGGRLVKTMGDGMLAEFSSVVAAVECAVVVQKLMARRNEDVAPEKRVVYRMGVNLGDVLIEGDDILGDGVNIAARLEALAQPGGICISGSAYEHVRGKINAAFTDLGEQQLKNIARPVRAYAIAPSDAADAHEDGPHEVLPLPPQLSPKLETAPRVSIMVLPFANIGGNPEQEYFADGVTESLTTDLSRMRDAFVIARNTAFAFKGKTIDIKQIGRELGVRYVLQGSLQRGGNRLRVNVQLVSTETGNQIWTDRFDKPVADLFDMQDEIVAHLARQLETELTVAEARHAERSQNPDSMDLYFQGMACANSGMTPDHMTRARGFFDRALALDQSNLRALVGAAMIDTMIGGAFFTADRAERLKAAETALTRALNQAPDFAYAHMLIGMVKMWTNRATDGIAESERALALDRNLANAHVVIGMCKMFLGRGGEVKKHIEEALRLSPRDRVAYLYIFQIGNGELYAGRVEEAVEWLRRSIEINRNFPLAHFYLGSALAQLGRIEEGKIAAANGLAFDPGFTIAHYRAGAATDNPAYLEQRERLIAGLRLIGIPEE